MNRKLTLLLLLVMALTSSSQLFSQVMQHQQTVADQYFSYYYQGTDKKGRAANSDNRMDGCSGPSAITGWEGFFESSCNKHDACYSAPWVKAGIGPGQSICDRAFIEDMARQCGNSWGECHKAATAMWAAVSLFAGNSYLGGQRFASKHGVVINNYTIPVSVSTGTVQNSGTDSEIYLYISGSTGSYGWIRLNPLINRNAFENGSTENLYLPAAYIGFPHWVCVYSDGSGFGPGWYLNTINVNGISMPFNEWVNGGEFHISDNAPTHIKTCPRFR